MALAARYVHTNLVAYDWRRLARFYQDVFGCVPVPPERHLRERWVEQATGIAGAEIHGMHLRLPGRGEGGPTLEVFQYGGDAPGAIADGAGKPVNRPGFAHVAFAVDDVQAAVATVQAAGGGIVGDVVSVQVAGAGALTFAYATDPEGNVIELQHWAR
jgi:predicted enzyme related to lactoylglutathione lyase